MATNTLLTTKKISDNILAPFVVSNPLLDNANTNLQSDYTNSGKYGIGGTVDIRKYPRYVTDVIDIANIPTGGIAITPQNIQQETETLTIEQLFNIPVNLNVVEEALQMKTKSAFNEFVLNPMVLSLKEQTMNYLYNKFLSSTYIFTGDATTRINDYSIIANTCALMDEFQMPKSRSIIMSAVDQAAFSSSQVQNNFYSKSLDDIWTTGYIGMVNGFKMYSDENIRVFKAGTAAETVGVTLLTAAVDGDTTLTLTGLTPGDTVNVSDKLQIDSTTGPGVDISAVCPIGKRIISNDLYPVTFIVADGTGNPDFAAGVYTVPGSGELTVSVVNPVRTAYTTDQYAYLDAPSNELTAGTGINLLGDHRMNIAMSNGNALSVAAPPPAALKYGAVSSMAHIDSIAVNCVAQSDASQLQNLFVCYMQLGALVHPEYCVGIISKA